MHSNRLIFPLVPTFVKSLSSLWLEATKKEYMIVKFEIKTFIEEKDWKQKCPQIPSVYAHGFTINLELCLLSVTKKSTSSSAATFTSYLRPLFWDTAHYLVLAIIIIGTIGTQA